MTDLGSLEAPAGEADALQLKDAALRLLLRQLGSVVVAFSGGVDSAFLAAVANVVLGARALSVTADSPSYPTRHREAAVALAERCGLRHEFVATSEMDSPDYTANPSNRCYYCKRELFGRLTALAQARGFAVVIDGNNADDRGDYRPGARRRASWPSAVRSTRRASPRRISASCRVGSACPPGTSQPRPACPRGSRTGPRSRSRNCR